MTDKHEPNELHLLTIQGILCSFGTWWDEFHSRGSKTARNVSYFLWVVSSFDPLKNILKKFSSSVRRVKSRLATSNPGTALDEFLAPRVTGPSAEGATNPPAIASTAGSVAMPSDAAEGVNVLCTKQNARN